MSIGSLSSGGAKLLAIILSLGLFPGIAPGQRPGQNWKRFVSREGGYVVYFPETWQELFPGSPTLEIVNFPPSQRVRAVVLPDAGASISVAPAPKNTTVIDEWIANNFQPGEVKSKTPVTLPRAASRERLQVTEVEWQEDSTGIAMQGVDCYFKISGHLFLGRLEYWKGNTNSTRYLQLLHDMLERISLTGN
jgi:hypothetical protein